jgi:hypothetical protein
LPHFSVWILDDENGEVDKGGWEGPPIGIGSAWSLAHYMIDAVAISAART